MSSLVIPSASIEKKGEPFDQAAVVIHEQALSVSVSRYVEMLSTTHPFNKDIMFDKRDVLHELKGFWPRMPKWKAEKHKIWAYISNAVQSVSAAGTNERVLLQIRVSSGSLSSNTHVESDEAMAVVAFDRVNGDMKSCLVPPMVDVPDLEGPHALSGILVVCQPFPKLVDKENDTHLYGAKAGSLYASRALDNPLSTNTFRGNEPEPLSIDEEQKMLQLPGASRTNAPRTTAAAALAALVILNREALEEELENERIETEQKDTARRLKAHEDDTSALRAAVEDRARAATVVGAVQASKMLAQKQSSPSASLPAVEENDDSTESLLPDVLIKNTETPEPPNITDAPIPTSNKTTDNPYPDDGNRLSTRENESGFERRVTDDVAPVSTIVAPVAVGALVLKSLPSSSESVAAPLNEQQADESVASALPYPVTPAASAPQAIIEPAPNLPPSRPAHVAPVVSALSDPSDQKIVAEPASQDATKVQEPAALGVTQPVQENVTTSATTDVASELPSAGLTTPLVSEAALDSLQEEPHRPATSPTASADEAGGGHLNEKSAPVSAASNSTESMMGPLESVHLATSATEARSDVTEPPPAATQNAGPATTVLHDRAEATAAPSSTQPSNNVSEEVADIPVKGMKETVVRAAVHTSLDETVAQTQPTSKTMASEAAPLAGVEPSLNPVILNSATFAKNMSPSSGISPELAASLALSGKHGPPPSAPRKETTTPNAPSPKGAALNPAHEAPVAQVEKRRKKKVSGLSKKKTGTNKMILKKQMVSVLAVKGHPATLENGG